ncbi:hypothetical protein [Clostridium sp. E02]|uniref:hypothetical protein n=1 Tax=Clostridium sp. E02 TaxID=2487134 RepID=UPI0013DE0354|nr:hypothetical protein [Clostridium sp. E02]
MELKDRVTIINKRNMNGLSQLYGKISTDELELIVNRYLAIAIDEIMEDENFTPAAM